MAKTSKEELIEFIRKNELNEDVIQKMMDVIDEKEKHATLDNLKEQSQATLDELMKIAAEGSKKVKSGVSQLADQAEQVGAAVKEKIANSEALDQIGNRLKSIVTKNGKKTKFFVGVEGLLDVIRCNGDIDNLLSQLEKEGFEGSIEECIEKGYEDGFLDFGRTEEHLNEVQTIHVAKVPADTQWSEDWDFYDYENLTDEIDAKEVNVHIEPIEPISPEDYGTLCKIERWQMIAWFEIIVDGDVEFDPSLLTIDGYKEASYDGKEMEYKDTLDGFSSTPTSEVFYLDGQQIKEDRYW